MLAYADDIVLLAPTVNSMRKMLACCDTYASDYNAAFNASKCKCTFFPAKGHDRKLNSTLVFEIGSHILGILCHMI